MFTFRIDDISINTNTVKLNSIVSAIFARFPESVVLLGISPVVFSSEQSNERVYPKILNAISEESEFFKADSCGLPDLTSLRTKYSGLTFAGHGIPHIDHRLLSLQAQEMSIVTSCSLANSSTFIPPFNKWNKDTEQVCKKHNIHLVKFEDGWRHTVYTRPTPKFTKYYFHTFDYSQLVQLEKWLDELKGQI
jgi:hypothetical protein